MIKKHEKIFAFLNLNLNKVNIRYVSFFGYFHMTIPEFSRVIKVDDSLLDTKFNIDATESELAKIATRLDLHSIKNMKLEYIITVRPDIPGAFNFVCHLTSDIVRFIIDGVEETCQIDEEFDVVLIEEQSLKDSVEILKNDDVEILDADGMVDIGEIASQYLSLFVYM